MTRTNREMVQIFFRFRAPVQFFLADMPLELSLRALVYSALLQQGPFLLASSDSEASFQFGLRFCFLPSALLYWIL
ncbi:hypothetical protein BRADI_4g13703v3 [Brachypodium distachyon]|uniref:Uncharacterized protein n=1 Tax=Brachypodium distachyon TaxID=15368 RepID=A0A2K2CML8_BRADI|nr:hypothetical protein BRADI_4g13703v3 [Brachypodium distachyon]